MLINIILGISVMLICLMFQSLLLVVSLSFYVNHHAWVESPRLGSRLLLLMSVMTLLLIGNFVQIGVWAWLFCGLDEFTDFATAYYFSCVNFATLGYGDIVMSERWRLLGPIESLNGIAMVGVSTSTLLWALQDTLRIMNQKKQIG